LLAPEVSKLFIFNDNIHILKREYVPIGIISFTSTFPIEKITGMQVESEIETMVAQALRGQLPVRSLPGVSIQNVKEQPEQPFDISFDLLSGPNRIHVLGEIKRSFTPRLLEEIAPWIRRLKALRGDVSIAVIPPALSPQAQAFCIENGIDFLDLAGNVFINVPGKFTLQRSGVRAPSELLATSDNARTVNVFSGRFSRVLRVLLEQPKVWTVTEIAGELESESRRFANRGAGQNIDFRISQGSISKAVNGLEEQLWIRRRGTSIIVPEPKRLLEQWAERYKERYRWRLRSSFQTGNPFGTEIAALAEGIGALVDVPYTFTGAVATTADAPYIDIDVVEVFVLDDGQKTARLRELKSQGGNRPPIRAVFPYDAGVFMYTRKIGAALVVSPVQAYLDLYARGGRDLKQAEYLLNNVIQPRWGKV